MSRDHVLFALIGLLAGFIAGYMMHEVMAARQPERLVQPAGSTTPGSATPAAPVAPPSSGAQPAAGGPAVAEVQELRARLAADPNDVAALRRLGNLNYDVADWKRAADLYERYLAQRTEDVDVITDLGACYRNLGRFDDALAQFRRARGLSPTHWQSRYNEILVLAFDVGDLEAADVAVAELTELQPENPEVRRLAEAVAERRQGA